LQILGIRKEAAPVHTPPASCPPPAKNPFFDDLYCPQSSYSDQLGTLYNTAPRSMGLAEEAQRIAAEFEYSNQDVNNGVKAFVAQMSKRPITEEKRGL